MFTSEIIVVFGILSKITNRIISVILITCMDKVIEIPSPIHLVTIVAIYLPTFAYDSTFAWNIWVYVKCLSIRAFKSDAVTVNALRRGCPVAGVTVSLMSSLDN